MAGHATRDHGPGRHRDPLIDEAVMYVALEQLAAHGIGGFSLTAVAAAAGTTRPAIYRRWASHIELLVDAISWLAATDLPPIVGDPHTDLVAEAEHFRHCMSDIGTIGLAAAMIGEGTDEALRRTYVEQISGPRATRIEAHLEQARQAGDLDPDADVALGASLLTGSWFAMAWAGREPGADWPERVVASVWRALGGRMAS